MSDTRGGREGKGTQIYAVSVITLVMRSIRAASMKDCIV